MNFSRDDILRLIATHTREVVPGLDVHPFKDSDRLAELGASSVDRADIIMLLQESLSLSIPRVQLFGPKNIGELADLLLLKLNG